VMVGAVLMAACAAIAFTEALGDGLRFAGCIAFSLFAGLVPSAVMAGAPTHARKPDEVSPIQGLIMQGSHLGQFIAAPLVAFTIASSGWNGILMLLVCAASVCLVCGWGLRRVERATL
jgi:hypothetical protein